MENDVSFITDGFWKSLQLLTGNVEEDKKITSTIVTMFQSQYFLDVITLFGKIQSLHKEIYSTIDEIEGRKALFFRTVTIEQTILSIKYYVIAWSTMFDLIAQLINIIYDIGFPEKDVNMVSMLKNKHVNNTEIANIINSYMKLQDFQYFKKQRNSIIHHGEIIDSNIIEMRDEINGLIGRQYSLLKDNKLPVEEFDKQYKILNEKIKTVAEHKKKEYREHYERTLAVIKALMKPFALKAYEYGEKIQLRFKDEVQR